ncbi:MAG: hypothetical protein KKA73_25435 [Chloroflexi bacterium]|nr:hypothetical protein [Chloroflexota bacterium]MBU1751040.1 hypothetical protein [Chloroflexota bacterium]
MRKLLSVLLVLCVVIPLMGIAPATVQGRPAAKPFVVARFPTKSEPHGVAVNPSNHKVYVANQESHNTTIYLDTEGGGILNPTYVTEGMHDEQIAVNPTNNRVWITKWSSGIVIGIDGTNDNMVEQVNVDVHPKGVAVNPNTGNCYVVCEETNRLHVIGEGVGAYAHVGVGRRPKFVAVNPNTNRIYTSNYDDGTVTVVDGNTNTTMGTIKVGTGPYGIAVNPTTNRIYVANRNSDNVTVIDGNSNTIVANIGLGAQPWVLAVNPTNNRIYVTLPDNTAYNLVAIDGGSNSVVHTMKVGRALREGIAVDPRTNRIYVTDLAEDYAYIVEDPPEGPTPTEGLWVGEYFSNPNLAGTPTFVRRDAYINFDWGTGSPDPSIPFDNFSVRWTGQINFAATNLYTFYATVDDGVRLYVDNHLIIDQWHTGNVVTYNGTINLTAGVHTVRMEYYESTGNSVAKLFWEAGSAPPPPPGTYFKGEYWANQYLQGNPTLVRNDPAINFNWGAGSPDPSIPVDHFSARWTGEIYASSTSLYTFYMTVDDGGRLWVDDALLLDKWYNQPVTTHTATMYLTQGYHKVKMEYYEDVWYAVAQLRWEAGAHPTPHPQPTPYPTETIIVDDASPGFTRGGPSSAWSWAPYGYNGRMFYTRNADSNQENWGRWTPVLPWPGYYNVYVFIPRVHGTTTNARYQIKHSGQWELYRVNQAVYYDKWVHIGRYYFTAQGGEFVYLCDVTYEPYLSREIAYDAVKFTYSP